MYLKFQIYADPLPIGIGSYTALSNRSATMNIECTLRPYTVVGNDVKYGSGTAEATFRSSDFEDGSYIDNEISILPTLSKEDRYILGIAYWFGQRGKEYNAF